MNILRQLFIVNVGFILSIVALFLFGMIPANATEVTVGGARTEIYAPMLSGKKVALLSNHTGILPDGRHTLDAMLGAGVKVTRLLSPEHGFRGTAGAGEHVSAGTYHITMIKVMEGAAKAGIPVIVMDRPNPLGWIVDGPVLDMKLRSGVGRLPIPVVHGMTMGELALAANGEGWLDGNLKCDLTVVPCLDYTHATRYNLPVAPSPNLRSTKAIGLYPSLCLMEGTTASVGRGTDSPFTIYGHPDMEPRGFSFTPRSMPGAKQPPHLGKVCQGVDLRGISDADALNTGFDPAYVIDAYSHMQRGADKFFSRFFDKLAGNASIRRMILLGTPADKIRDSWADEVYRFKQLRHKYLLYPEK